MPWPIFPWPPMITPEEKKKTTVMDRMANPRLLAALSGIGAGLSQPRQFGQSGMQHFAQGLAGGIGGINAYDAQQAANAVAAQKALMDQQRLNIDAYKAIEAAKADEERNRIRMEGVNVNKKRVKLDKRRLEMEDRRNQDELDLKWSEVGLKWDTDRKNAEIREMEAKNRMELLKQRERSFEASMAKQAESAEERAKQLKVKNELEKERLNILKLQANNAARNLALREKLSNPTDAKDLEIASRMAMEAGKDLLIFGSWDSQKNTYKRYSIEEASDAVRTLMEENFRSLKRMRGEEAPRTINRVQENPVVQTPQPSRKVPRSMVERYANEEKIPIDEAIRLFNLRGIQVE